LVEDCVISCYNCQINERPAPCVYNMTFAVAFCCKKKITFHSKWLLGSLRVTFQDGNILLSFKTRQIKRWNLELLEQRKHLSRPNCRFVKAYTFFHLQKSFRAANFLGNALALLRVYSRVNYTFDCKFCTEIAS